MTTYIPILNAEIDPDSPITTGLMTRIRDNPIAIIEGAVGAPRATSRIITPGGSAADGNMVNATVMNRCGFFDFSTITLSANVALESISFIRCDGNVIISSGAILSALAGSAGADAFDKLMGSDGATAPPGAGGGGGVIGNGGTGSAVGGVAALSSAAMANILRFFMNKRPMIGGNGGSSGSHPGGRGGGFVCLFVNGDMVLSGGTITVEGQPFQGPGSSDLPGGGGGGGLIIVCNGTITDGTFKANGGLGGDSGGTQKGGGGGGGYICTVAKAYAGTQTYDVAGGAAYGGASVGGAGAFEKLTYTEPQINAMLLR